MLKHKRHSSRTSQSPKISSSRTSSSSRRRSSDHKDQKWHRIHVAKSSSSPALCPSPKRSSFFRNAKDRDPSLEVIRPIRKRYEQAIDHRNYCLVNKSSEHDGIVERNIAKSAKWLKTQIRSHTFHVLNPISVIIFQSTFTFACSTNRIHAEAGMCLFYFFLKSSSAAILNVCWCVVRNSSTNTRSVKKKCWEFTLKWYWYTIFSRCTQPMTLSPKPMSLLRHWRNSRLCFRHNTQQHWWPNCSHSEKFRMSICWRESPEGATRVRPSQHTIIL